MRTAILWSLCMICLAIFGCVSAYDATDPSPRIGATRAEAVGAHQPRVRVARWSPPEDGTQAPAPVTAQATPAARAAAITLPDSALGREIAWVVSVLNGADLGGARGKAAIESHFSASFLEKVPVEQIRAVMNQTRREQFESRGATLSRFTPAKTQTGDIDPNRATALIRGDATGRYIQLRIAVDAEGKIAGLLVAPMSATAAEGLPSFAALTDALTALAGPDGAPAEGRSLSIGLGIYTLTDPAEGRGEAKPIAVLGESRPLALGSAFKLWILAALAQETAAGNTSLAWNKPLAIRDDFKSLPSGKMQLIEAGTEFPITHFAREMISISDNTATDHLLFAVGRERVEKTMRELTAAPERNVPFLSTHEMFKLKLGADRDLAKKWATERDVSAKQRMLAKDGAVESQVPNLMLAAAWTKPYFIDTVEWFATPRDLAVTMAELRRLERLPGNAALSEVLRVNPGIGFDRSLWKSIAYKGGSEPGVMNMTWLLERRDGRWFVLTITFNDTAKEIDEGAVIGYATAAADLLGTWREP